MSFHYRKNKAAIWAGDIPARYKRVAEAVTGSSIIEIGGAEAVLALLLANRGRSVTSVELSQANHDEAVKLKAHWRKIFGDSVDHVELVNADIRERHDLLAGKHSLVAVRSIYYLRDDAQELIVAAKAAGVAEILLCGNGRRARDPRDEHHRLASVEGMRALCLNAGYAIARIEHKGDPMVIAKWPA